MEKRKGLRKLFNSFAAAAVLGFGLTTATSRADEPQAPPPVAQVIVQDTSLTCAAYPNFKRPEGPMHRQPRTARAPDVKLRAQQQALQALDINPGRADGFPGAGSRAAGQEFVLFYGPLYDGEGDGFGDADAAAVSKYAALARTDGKTYGITPAKAAALRMAAERTDVPFATLAAQSKKGTLPKFSDAEWLYMVRQYGAQYGLSPYAAQVTLEGSVTNVANPFLHRQILSLRNQPRIAALMAAEYIKNKPDLYALSSPAAAAVPQAQQADLAAIGFDTGVSGAHASLAAQEFQLLYGAGQPTGILNETESTMLADAARRARDEARDFAVPTVATGAIHMAAERGNFDFAYMMELAEAESGFRHGVRASTSTATGLYQFIESTWSWMMMLHGSKYGMKPLAAEVEIYKDDLGRSQARIKNPILRAQIMEMRKHPHLSSLMSAQFQRENRGKEACYVPGEITRTDMYIAHFLGAHDAVWFLNEMKRDPKQSAAKTFPEAAQYNVNIFYVTKGGRKIRERTLEEVYDLFAKKFDRDAYESTAPRIVRSDEPPSPLG